MRLVLLSTLNVWVNDELNDSPRVTELVSCKVAVNFSGLFTTLKLKYKEWIWMTMGLPRMNSSCSQEGYKVV